MVVNKAGRTAVDGDKHDGATRCVVDDDDDADDDNEDEDEENDDDNDANLA